MSRIKTLRERVFAGIPGDARAIREAAEKENRDLTADETAKITALTAEKQAALAQLDQLTSLEALTQVDAGRAQAALTSGPAPSGVEVGADLAAKRPFKSLGEQLKAVHLAATGQTDTRLLELNAAASGMGEAVPADGGFLVQQDYSSELMKPVFEGSEILKRVRTIPIGAGFNGIKLNGVDETSRANGSRWGGVQSYWAGEADTVTATKPKFRRIAIELEKLLAICYATDEMLEDATALESIITQAFTEEMIFKAEDAIFEGDGAGKPLGLLASGSLVTQAAEGSQTATTINAQNVVKMKARMFPRSFQNAVWLLNSDAEPQLPLMTIGQQPVYLPPGGLSGNQYGMLLGRPVIPVEYASTLGAVGDIMLVDLGMYALAEKGGIRGASSMHVRFLNDEMTYRFTYRVNGQPVLASALTPFKGTLTKSSHVVLAAR